MRISKVDTAAPQKEGSRLAAAQAEAQPVVRLLYRTAVDLRICLILSRLGFKVKPLSTLEAFHRSRSKSGLVVVDVDSDLEGGAAIIEQLVARYEESTVVCLCSNGSIEFFRRCFRVGVVDILDKSFDDGRVTDAFAAIRAATARRLSSFASLRQRQLRYAALTQKEREVFGHLLQGLTNREIAELLGLSRRTVEIHRAHIQKKLHVRNTTQMAAEYTELASGVEPERPAPGGLARAAGRTRLGRIGSH